MEYEINGNKYWIDFSELEEIGGFQDGCRLKYKEIDELFFMPVSWTDIFELWVNSVEVKRISMDIELTK
ncbi:MAG: hypothetical protein EOP48_14275 [Sphingobacteriales bacterium]|nr:MAG: hypothetical protein EOP48_14275 [Sphingobacteriales bacterium]